MYRMNRKNIQMAMLPSALIVPTLFMASCQSTENHSAAKPKEGKQLNIIHIMTDDHAFQAISAYGDPLSRLAPTPHLDRLAQQGILFCNAYV